MTRYKTILSVLLMSGVFVIGQTGWLAADEGTVSIRADENWSFDPAEYWTDETISEAESMFWNEEPSSGIGLYDGAPADLGPPGSTPGGASTIPEALRDAGSDAGSDDADSDASGGGGQEAESPITNFSSTNEEDFGTDFGTQDVFDKDFANKKRFFQKKQPWRNVGKLFFTTPGGNAYCTASVISGNNNIVTAAHCCHAGPGGGFFSNWAFAPAIRKTNRPFGTFPWASLTVLTEWGTSGTRRSDVCVLTLGPNASGQNVSATVGWLGRSWNFGPTQHNFTFGYPSDIRSGDFQYWCAAETFGASGACGGIDVLNMGCNMTFGSSGGPWIRKFKQLKSTNRVNAVVSGWDSTTCTGTFGQTFNGPRFTSNNIVLLCNAQGC